jgi:segregation and condensation protein A
MPKKNASNSAHQDVPVESEDRQNFSVDHQCSSFIEVPKDLYIPPNALEVFLEAFEGPLDLLLYMIKRQNLNILEINVAEITHQYMGYINLMEAMHLELVSEYL